MRQFGRFGPLVGSIDEGTSSARFMVFAANTSEMLTYHQIPVKTITPKEGWAEQDPMEILYSVIECIEITIDNLQKLDINPEDIVAVGISNQRETTIVWDYITGKPLYNAIVWMDNRTSEMVEQLASCGPRILGRIKDLSGLPLSGYFSAPKLRWLMLNCQPAREAVSRGTCMAGTVDSWLIWNLSGGSKGGLHMTDVSNASRTMLMNITTLQWDPELCRFFGIPSKILPVIKSSSEIYGYIHTGSLTGIPISGCLGDQQAALVGQMCFDFGQAKCTFGTGAFLLYNTGKSIIKSKHGLITTVAYKLGPNSPTIYALEGSVAMAGAALEWLEAGLGVKEDLLLSADEVDAVPQLSLGGRLDEKPKKQVIRRFNSGLLDDEDKKMDGEVLFVPAFSGLYAPYWRKDARSVICGITSSTDCSQLARGALRAAGLQTRALLEALQADTGRSLSRLLAGGALSASGQLMQAEADMCGISIVRPLMTECSALGAAMAAGRASGIDVWPRKVPPPPSDSFHPTTGEDDRNMMYVRWQMALDRSFGLANEELPLEKDKVDCDMKGSRPSLSLPASIFFISSCLLLLIASKLKS